MLSSHRYFWMLAAVLGIIIVVSQGVSPCYGLNKPTVPGAAKQLDLIVTEPANSCDQGLCVDLYPKDRKIEGKQVSLLTPAGVNNAGQVVGLCIFDDPSNKFPFVREADGRIWIFKTPSKSGEGEFTDINDSGKAVGFYAKDSSSSKIGFIMSPQGQWMTDIQYPANPCPATRSHLHTAPNGINNVDEIVGNFDCTARAEDAADPLSRGNGFYRSPDGTFYRIQFEIRMPAIIFRQDTMFKAKLFRLIYT